MIPATCHGCYQIFMADLRDAYFIPNEDDLQIAREMLEWQDIKKESIREYHYFLRRVRRHVPLPEEQLEKRYMHVVELYRDVNDANNGSRFFSTKAEREHGSVLGRIGNNCLSIMIQTRMASPFWNALAER
jgi:hypothetical protein